MKNNGLKRRDFFRKSLLAGTGLATTRLISYGRNDQEANELWSATSQDYVQKFNMSGYAAPKIPLVRIGFIGLGMRGSHAPKRIQHIEGTSIKAICDIREEKVMETQYFLKENNLPKAAEYFGSEDSWKQLCERDDIDLVYITTPWHLHTPMAVYAMEQGKHVAVEVPACKTIEEAWQLVETSEKTKKHCMMLENCCYDFFELLTLNMARQGYFGEIVHAEGAYIHDLRWLNTTKPENSGYYDMWRLKENTRNGSLYPTHGLGPVCQVLNINRGDQMDFLTSTSTADFMLSDLVDSLADEDTFFQPYAGKAYRGNMNNTVVKTKKGKSILIQHDVTSPRPYSRIHLISGTKAMARKYPKARIADGHEWVGPEEFERLKEKYTPEIVNKVGELARQVGGHGGMDFIMDWQLIDCLRNGLPLDQDVYDAALWSSIAPLSELSVSNRSESIDVPDFTCGAWKTNKPVNLELSHLL